MNYLLFAIFPISSEKIKIFKSTEGYNQFISGFAKEVSLQEICGEGSYMCFLAVYVCFIITCLIFELAS